MTALEALNLAAPLADTYSAVEQRLLVSIARQLSLNDDHSLNEVSKWQIKRLARLGMLRKDAARIVAAGTKGVPADFTDTVQQAITSALAEDGLVDMWQNESFAESAKQAVKHYRRQAQSVYNQVNTVMKYKAESSFVRAVNSVADKWTQNMRRQQSEIADKQAVLDILNSNTADVVNGSEARTRAVRTTIREMAQRGIPAFVDRAGREWSPEAYVNMDIRATVKNTALEAKFSVMDSLGQDVFEVSSHPGSRPKCRPWQGKLISRSGKTTEITDLHGRKHKVIPLSQTSFGEPDGLFGINCGHRPRGCTEGVFTKSAVAYDDEADKELYNKVCRQRELERKVRKSKTEADMLEAAGDTEGAKEVRRRMAEQNRQLRAYCESNGLKFRSDRVRTYGAVEPKKSLDKSVGSGIIKTRQLAQQRNFSVSDYDIVEDISSVEEFKRFVSENMGITTITGIDMLKNGEQALKIISKVDELSKIYNKRFSRISIIDCGDMKIAAETSVSELRLNVQLLNRPDALVTLLDEWEKTGFIPKGCNRSDYIAKHEYFHLLSQDIIDAEKSKVITEIRRQKLEPVSDNAKKDAHEYVADLLSSIKLSAKHQKLRETILKIIQKG